MSGIKDVAVIAKLAEKLEMLSGVESSSRTSENTC